jgi:hypothetical protein
MREVALHILIQYSLIFAWLLVGVRVGDRLMRERPDADWIGWVCLVFWPVPVLWRGVSGPFRRNRAEPAAKPPDAPPKVLQLAELPPAPPGKPGQGLLRKNASVVLQMTDKRRDPR